LQEKNSDTEVDIETWLSKPNYLKQINSVFWFGWVFLKCSICKAKKELE